MTTTTITLNQLSKTLVGSAKKAAKQRKEQKASVLAAQSQSHNWHFGHCLDCGISSTKAESDICPQRSRLEAHTLWMGVRTR